MPSLEADPRALSQHPYASFLHKVEKPARYVGGEPGQTRKPWSEVQARVCLAFPDIYDIGMSHLGTRILYSVLNAAPDVLCERSFVPWHDLDAELRARGLPLVSLESGRALREFDVVGISLQHELVFTNVLTLLDLGGIPLRAADRGEEAPLVLGGGSVATHPEPMAPFFDAFVVGDGERLALEVSRQWAADRRAGLPRAERLRRLAALGGVYVPSLYATRVEAAHGREVVDHPLHERVPMPVRREVIPDLEEYPFPVRFPAGGTESVFERLSIEVARGCMQGCRFCQAGIIFRPQRDRDPARLVETIEEAVRIGGDDEVSLTSLSTADYPHIGELIGELSDRLGPCHVALGVSSLRAYGVSGTVLERIRKVRATGLTFAPEAGTQRMRDLINKNVTEEQITDTAERALRLGWDKIKFYFMIGLPTETPEDLEGIVQTTVRAREAAKGGRSKKARPVRITASVSTFVPKPHTPLQWERMNGLDEVFGKQRLLKDRARERGLDLKVHEPHGSILEGILSRGDRRVAIAIEHAWRAGARFDAWDGSVKWDVWLEAFAAAGIDPSAYLAAWPVGVPMPWSHIDVGVSPEFLNTERDKAFRGLSTPPCGRPFKRADEPDEVLAARKPVCMHCGLECDLDLMTARTQQGSERLATIRTAVTSTEPSAAQEAPKPIQPHRIRLRFEKLGWASLLGHLDLVREVPRALRRANMPVWYSQGFHPKPVLTFGPALSLGVPSFDEYVDVKFSAAVDPKELVRALSGNTPDGIRFLEAIELEPGAPAIGAVIRSAHYVMGLPPELGAALEMKLAAQTGRKHALEGVVIERETDVGKRSLDLGELIEALEPGTDEDRETLARGGIAGQWWPVRVVVGITQTATVRLQEIAVALTGREEVEYRAVRTSLRGEGGVSAWGPSSLRASG